MVFSIVPGKWQTDEFISRLEVNLGLLCTCSLQIKQKQQFLLPSIRGDGLLGVKASLFTLSMTAIVVTKVTKADVRHSFK